MWEEKLLNINYALINEINESTQGHQISLTSNALFTSNINDADWVELDTSVSLNDQIQYSPNGDLYINRIDHILYSEDNGESFSTIELPESGFPINSFYMQVLDDGVILIGGYLLLDIFYTKNNGQDWTPVGVPSSLEFPHVKLVGNTIIIAELVYDYTVTTIDINTNATMNVELGLFYNTSYSHTTIQDDGTVYFYGLDLNGSDPEGLYRYRIGEGLEFVGQFQELTSIRSLQASGTDLFGFAPNEYYLFEEDAFTEHSYTGLPMGFGNFKTFIKSDNEHLYVIVDNHRIFRSIEPLSYPKFITGSIYNDVNLDCQLDISDPTLSHWKVKVEGDDYLRVKSTDNAGSFNFSVPEGEFTLSSQPINPYWSLCESSFNVAIDDNNTIVNQDFVAKALADCAELEIDFSTPFLRRCFDNYYTIKVRNTGPQTSDGTTLTLGLDPFFENISATLPYTQVDDSTLVFDLGILDLNDEITFKVYFFISCEAALGAEHCLTGSLTDANICDNNRSTYTECQENIGSYDPNDKRIFNENGFETETVDKEEYIFYHIRFQNTGTDTAFNVKIVDQLSPILDLNTLVMLSSSHPYVFTITDGPSLEVVF